MSGPDGALWFVNRKGHSIGRITTSGAVTRRYTGKGALVPEGIAAGGGTVWFTSNRGTRFHRLTPAGWLTTAAVTYPAHATVMVG